MTDEKKEPSSGKSKKRLNESDYYKLQEKIIENLIDLQKVHTNMAEKFDKLSNSIASLLNLFDTAARSFADYPANQGSDKDKEFLEKRDRLLEQNKTIAKGLTLMEERVRERLYGAPNPAPQVPPLMDESEDYQSSSMNKSPDISSIERPLPKF